MRRRLSHRDSKTPPPYDRSPDSSPCNRGPHPCCFCWCCCCSCSCLTVPNKDQDVCSRRASNISTLESLQRNEDSGRLSVEEASSWALSFSTLLDNASGRDVFMEFLRSEHSDENMLFWQACEDLKTEQQKADIGERAKQVYLDYISILSPKEVSIDATVRETINRNMATPTVHVFDDAQAQIYALMHRDSYPRFLNSPLYQSLLQSLSSNNSSNS
ncbi:regulator of G-protein signaling 20-like [Huso huso]|uniref:Regulator of G-protein signaling 20-like n=1 Tax=Huso huso TaxID=61971 RepID=A0ABR0YPZ6_HUSHU|nr:regulator of G-protein signaling 20-like [Acipenser ruthenus]